MGGPAAVPASYGEGLVTGCWTEIFPSMWAAQRLAYEGDICFDKDSSSRRIGERRMGRLVRPSRIVIVENRLGGVEGVIRGDSGPTETRIQEQGDTYLERVAKYIPAELIAFYIFANPILMQSLQTPGTMAGYSVAKIGIAIFFASWALTPIYLWRLGTPDDARLTNVAVATALFPIWAYAVQGVGPTQFIPFDGHLASIVLGAATLVSGLLIPSAAKPAVDRSRPAALGS